MAQTHPHQALTVIMDGLEKLRAQADGAFAKVAAEFPAEINCKPGCDDCCHALFDLSPVEALALALGFMELPRDQRRQALKRGKKAAAQFDKVMQQAMGQEGDERIMSFSRARIRCPLLQDQRCLLYHERPLTCRLYGIPVAVQGKSHICHLAGFQPGQTYPTVDRTLVQNGLEGLSALALKRIPSLPYARRDVARALELCHSHGPLLRALRKEG